MVPNSTEEPMKVLPPSGVSIKKEIDIIKAYVALRGHKSALSYKDVAPSAGLSETDVSRCLKFLYSIGALVRASRGNYSASPWTVQLVEQLGRAKETDAWAFLAEQLRKVWFVQHTIAAFAVSPSMKEEELVKALGRAAGLSGHDQDLDRSLALLIDLLKLVGIVRQDEAGNFTLNSTYVGKPAQKQLQVTNETEIYQIEVDGVTYAIDLAELREFVTRHGKRLSEKFSLS